MNEWIEPKTDWKFKDTFNIVDYNRIKNNLDYLCDAVKSIYGNTTFEDTGNFVATTLEGHKTVWNYVYFNAWESNLDKLSIKFYGYKKFGARHTFYPNGTFITYAELNRIERACLQMKAFVKGWENARTRLPFEMGAPRDIRL